MLSLIVLVNELESVELVRELFDGLMFFCFELLKVYDLREDDELLDIEGFICNLFSFFNLCLFFKGNLVK